MPLLEWGPVQTPAPGLLSLLNLKSTGQLPDKFTNQILPVLGQEGFLLRGSLQDEVSAHAVTVAAAPVGAFTPFTQPLTVPNNETWYLEAACVNGAAGGAGAVVDEYALAYQMPGGPNPMYVIGNYNNVAAAKPSSMSSALGVWLPAGARIGVWIGTITTNPGVFTLSGFRFARLLL